MHWFILEVKVLKSSMQNLSIHISHDANEAGLTFVSVHDCYWTHAVTVDTMNRVCREQFVALHSQPILEELSGFLLKKYCSRPPSVESSFHSHRVISKPKKFEEYYKMAQLLASVPQTGDFDLEKVKESVYFFS
ncbi:hypothetical protein cypCar_00037452 [Cyprinus carpio]|nr:hypothetical protein cypCar_00037452 [Cyprinus carpio]